MKEINMPLTNEEIQAFSMEMATNLVERFFEIEDAREKQKKVTQFKKILGKYLFLALKDGFDYNLFEIESGLMTANAGDAAQFLFLSRAMMAGFNCSNVDVRSSRYDAVIDYNNKILRVQVKGVSNEQISFKDRDRGGQGIDPANPRNIGRRISSEECDIYVAVDKKTGICYIIPVTYIEEIEGNSKAVSFFSDYRENWNIIRTIAGQ